MRKELKNFFVEFKLEIINSLTDGNVYSLLAELSLYILEEDRDSIKRRLENDGRSWAAEALLACIECSDEAAFVKFLDYLKRTPTTEEMYWKIHHYFVAKGFDFILPGNQPDSNVFPRSHKMDAGNKEAARRIIKELSVTIRESFTEGGVQNILAYFQSELDQSDIERVKATLKNQGKTLAVDTLLECLLNAGRRTFKKFILYLSEKQLELFEQFRIKCHQYGLSDLLPADGKGNGNIHNSEGYMTKSTSCREAEPNKERGIFPEEETFKKSSNKPAMVDAQSEAKPNKERRKVPVEESFLNQQQVENEETEENILQPGSATLSVSASPSKKNGIECYKMLNSPKGICLIINNSNFSESRKEMNKGYSNRPGSDIDEKKLTEVFCWLGFVVKVYKDLTAMELWEVILQWSKADHSKYDCFVFCLLSHGSRYDQKNIDEVCGVDGKMLAVDTIVDRFNGNNCRTLVGKPKLFFFQCCRGTIEDRGVTFKENIQDDGPIIDVPSSLPVLSDIFIGYSTPPGCKSWRNPTEGSWYITKLCEVFAEMAPKWDLMSMVTKVNHEVSKFYTERSCKQIPNPTMTLRKLLFFKPTTDKIATVNYE